MIDGERVHPKFPGNECACNFGTHSCEIFLGQLGWSLFAAFSLLKSDLWFYKYRMVGAGVTFLEPRTAIESNDEPCKTFFLGARRSPCFSFGRNACILIVFMHVHVLYVIIVMHLSMCSYLYSCLCVLMYRFWCLFMRWISFGRIWNKPYLTWASIDAAGCSWAVKVICLHSSESLIATAMVNWPWMNFVPLGCCVPTLFQRYRKQHTESCYTCRWRMSAKSRQTFHEKSKSSTLHTVYYSIGNI